jgi:hypothetical protein
MIVAPKQNMERDYEIVPAGNHVARLFKIINIGTIDTGFQNEDGSPKVQPKVRLYFELTNKTKTYTDKDGVEVTKPFAISKEVTLSLYKGTLTAKLREITEAILGKALTDAEAEVYDIEKLMGLPCMVQVNHEKNKEGNVFAKLATVSSLPEGLTAPELVNTPTIQNVNFMTLEEIAELPEFLRDKMQSSLEYKSRFKDLSASDVPTF